VKQTMDKMTDSLSEGGMTLSYCVKQNRHGLHSTAYTQYAIRHFVDFMYYIGLFAKEKSSLLESNEEIVISEVKGISRLCHVSVLC